MRCTDQDPNFTDDVLGIYEELYQFPCYSPWPPTVASVADRMGLDEKEICEALAALNTSGELRAVHEKYPNAPERDRRHIPPVIVEQAVQRELWRTSAEAGLPAEARFVRITRLVFPEDSIEELAKHCGLSVAKTKKALALLEEKRMLAMPRFPGELVLVRPEPTS